MAMSCARLRGDPPAPRAVQLQHRPRRPRRLGGAASRPVACSSASGVPEGSPFGGRHEGIRGAAGVRHDALRHGQGPCPALELEPGDQRRRRHRHDALLHAGVGGAERAGGARLHGHLRRPAAQGGRALAVRGPPRHHGRLSRSPLAAHGAASGPTGPGLGMEEPSGNPEETGRAPPVRTKRRALTASTAIAVAAVLGTTGLAWGTTDIGRASVVSERDGASR